MAQLSTIEPWETETPGERLFLLIYSLVSSRAPLLFASESWVVSSGGLTEFVRLVVAMELTHRCLNVGTKLIEDLADVSPEAVQRELQDCIGIYSKKGLLRQIAEATRLSAIAYVERKLTDGQINSTHKNNKAMCCWCGAHTSRAVGTPIGQRATVEHLWPEFLGGTSSSENLTIACDRCNSTRQHAFTWAWFGLQAVNEKLDAKNGVPREIRLALALHRLMRVASGQTGLSRTKVTLKQACKILKCAMPTMHLEPDKRYTFFEIFHLAGD